PEAPARLASQWTHIPNPDGGAEVWFGRADHSYIEEARRRGGDIAVSGLPARRVSDLDKADFVTVTGGSGFLGRNLVQRLLDAGHRVKVLDLPGTAQVLPRSDRLV